MITNSLIPLLFHLFCSSVWSQNADQILTVIKGELNFKDAQPNILPPGSCIWFRIYESRMEQEEESGKNREFVVSRDVEYVGNKFIKNGHSYSLPFKKLHYVEERDYYVIADLFVGRCPHIDFISEAQNDQKIPGDYSSRFARKVNFNEYDVDDIVRINLPVYRFCLDWDCKKNPVAPPEYCYDKINNKVIADMGHHRPVDQACKQCICSNGSLECGNVVCQRPTSSCQKVERSGDACCPCDAETAVKRIQWNIKLKLNDFKTEVTPLGSCLIFKVKNTFNRIIHAKVVYVGGQNLNPKYQLNFHRETRSLRTAYGLIISLHRGWCPNVSKLYKTEPTLANNDYENKIEWPYKTRMEPGKTEYKSEITMIQKCIGSTCATDAMSHCVDKQGNRREKFSTWKVDECIDCFCNKRAQIECARQQCHVTCDASVAVKKPGQCCPQCPKQHPCYDHMTNKTYNEGELWKRGDGCIRCTCFGGMAACMTSACRLPKCGPTNFLVNVDGLCCPICNNVNICDSNGAKREEGTYWQNEDCTVCQCTADGTKCFNPNEDLSHCGRGVKMSNCPRFCLPQQ